VDFWGCVYGGPCLRVEVVAPLIILLNRLLSRLVYQFGYVEIQDFDLATLGNEHVGRIEVPMYYSFFVHVVEPLYYFFEDLFGLLFRISALLLNFGQDMLAIDLLHDQVASALVLLSDVVKSMDDVGMAV
jgi:hypothetical protein